MRVIFLGKNKPSCIEALKYLVKKKIKILYVIGPKEAPLNGGKRLIDVAKEHKIPSTTDYKLYKMLFGKIKKSKLNNIDLVISYLFWKKIRKPLIELPKIGCINFHPHPLPLFRGWGGYAFGIYENVKKWGVSAHFVDENFDTGDIIEVKKFSIKPQEETAFSLEQKSMKHLLSLFKKTINKALHKKILPRSPQGKGRYFSKKDFENLRKISTADSENEIERKTRAFWFPPYPGAQIELGGKKIYHRNQKINEKDKANQRKTKNN